MQQASKYSDQSVLLQKDIDYIKSAGQSDIGKLISTAQILGGYTNTKFAIGEDVVLWINRPEGCTPINGTVIDIGVGDLNGCDIALYNLAVSTQIEGIYVSIHNIGGNISKAGTLVPEHPVAKWPLEVLKDNRVKPKPKLRLVSKS